MSEPLIVHSGNFLVNAAFGSHQISEAGDDGFSAFGRHHAASASEEKRCLSSVSSDEI